MKNNHLYNDKELWVEADLNWYDYGFRNYDPQIGRFPQLDPLTFSYPHYTPYQYAGNEPIANVDLDGLEPLGAIGAATNAAAGFGNLAVGISKALSVSSIGINAAKIGLNFLNNILQKKEIKDNVAIFIGKSGEKYAKQSNNKDEDEWHVIVKNNITDANKSLQRYRRKKQLSNIILETHGTQSGNEIVSDGENSTSITEKTLEGFNKDGTRYLSVIGLQNIGNCLKPGGNLVLTACNLVK